MKAVAEFLLMNILLIASQMIAAGVVLFGAPVFKLIPGASEMIWPWVILMLLAITATLCFLKAATS